MLLKYTEERYEEQKIKNASHTHMIIEYTDLMIK